MYPTGESLRCGLARHQKKAFHPQAAVLCPLPYNVIVPSQGLEVGDFVEE